MIAQQSYKQTADGEILRRRKYGFVHRIGSRLFFWGCGHMNYGQA